MRTNITRTQTSEFLNRQLEILDLNPPIEADPVFPGTGRTIGAVPQPRGEWDIRGQDMYTRDYIANEYNEITINETRILNDIGDGILEATTTLWHDPQINNYADRVRYTEGLTPQQETGERLNFLIEQITAAFNPQYTVNSEFAQVTNNPTFIQIGDIVTPLMLQGRENIITGMRQNINLAELMQQAQAHIEAANRFNIGPIEFYRGFHRVNWGQTRINIEEFITRVDIFMHDIMEILFYTGEETVRGLIELIQYYPLMTILVLLIQFPLFIAYYLPFQIIDRISIQQLTRLFRRAIHSVMYRMNRIRLRMEMQQIIGRHINIVITTNNEIVNETRTELRNNTNRIVHGNNEDVARTNLANTNTFLQNIVNGVTTFAQYFTGTNIGRMVLINGIIFLATNYPQLVNTWGNWWRTIAPTATNIPFIRAPREIPTQDLPRPPAELIPHPHNLEDQTTRALIDILIKVGREIFRRLFSN